MTDERQRHGWSVRPWPSYTMRRAPGFSRRRWVGVGLFCLGVVLLSCLPTSGESEPRKTSVTPSRSSTLSYEVEILGVSERDLKALLEETSQLVALYVGVSEGADPTTGSTSVEVQITPNITLGTDVRQDGASNVGIKWRWDY